MGPLAHVRGRLLRYRALEYREGVTTGLHEGRDYLGLLGKSAQAIQLPEAERRTLLEQVSSSLTGPMTSLQCRSFSDNFDKKGQLRMTWNNNLVR